MEVDENLNDKTNKICRLVLNFAHDELLNQFINNNGNCKETTYQLLNSVLSNEILESDKITKEHHYKLLFTYLVYLYSKYLKTNKIQILLNIKEKIFDENSTRLLPFVIINQFKTICLKTMAYLIKKNPLEEYCVEFENFIDDHELIGDIELYEGYNNDALYKDICEIIKIDKQKHKTALLKLILEYFDKKYNDDKYIDSPEPIIKLLESLKSPVKLHPTNPLVNKTPEKFIDEMILEGVCDNEVDNSNKNLYNDVDMSEKENNVNQMNSRIIIEPLPSIKSPTNNDADMSEKENNVDQTNSRIIIEPLPSIKSPTNNDANNFFINLRTPFVQNNQNSVNTEQQILKEKPNNELTLRNLIEDENEVYVTPNFRNKLRITEEALCASPKILTNKIPVEPNRAESSSSSSDSEFCYNLRRQARLNRTKTNKSKKASQKSKSSENNKMEITDKSKEDTTTEKQDIKGEDIDIQMRNSKRIAYQTRPFNEEEIVLVDDDDDDDDNNNNNCNEKANKKINDNNKKSPALENKEPEAEKVSDTGNKLNKEHTSFSMTLDNIDDDSDHRNRITDASKQTNENNTKASTSKKNEKQEFCKTQPKSTRKSVKGRKSMASNILDNDDDEDGNISSVSLSGSNFRNTEMKSSSIKTNPKSKKKSKLKIKSDSENEGSTSENEELKFRKRRTKNVWDEKEIIYLVYGVQKFGKGNWAAIYTAFKSKFKKERTNIDLKDKYRNLVKRPNDLEHYENQAQLLGSRIKKEIETRKSKDNENGNRSSSNDSRNSRSASHDNKGTTSSDKKKCKKF